MLRSPSCLYATDLLTRASAFSIPQKSEAEVDEVLNKSVAVFRFLTEKDAFERYYNQHLSKRLLNQKSVSDDAERNMLSKFRIEAGSQFTKAAEGMMRDVKVSDDTVQEYKRFQDRASVVSSLNVVWPECWRQRD